MANPTTNYSFVLPTATDLVTDLPADFDVALQGVDTRLKALQPGTTLGDLAYSSATANTNTRLAIGSTGNVLTVAGGVPTWSAPAAGGGKVLQVVNATNATAATSTSTTFADTGLTATITPTLATSKILVLVNQAGCMKDSDDTACVIQLLRGASVLAKIVGLGGQTDSGLTNNFNAGTTSYLDSPATTSATTYKTQFKVSVANLGRALVQAQSSVSTITLLEIGV